MSANDHPFFDEANRFAASPVSRREAYANVGFVAAYEPAARTEMLQEVEKRLHAEDGSSLQQKAQLLTFHRALSDADRALRLVSR